GVFFNLEQRPSNSYEVFWDITADKLRDKLYKENLKFWNNDRLNQSKNIGLTPLQVCALASIVHKETVKADERPRIAGVYLNRIKQGMPLQADPTAIFAYKKSKNDFNMIIKRVVNEHISIESPYNTYKVLGIPPGPIFMPDINAIDAVLNPEQHDYIYFCASVTKFGYHDFAISFAQHSENAKKYQAWLNNQNIK
ncbi:MAG: endolytic transglycosylase MltG, partial [Flavobacterium sp.]